MRIRARLRGGLLAFLVFGHAAAGMTGACAQAQDARSACYRVTDRQGDFFVQARVFRQAALARAIAVRDLAKAAKTESTLPVNATRCTGEDPNIPAAGPARTNYFGRITNKEKFLQLSANCKGTGQYFSIGQAIYYRRCPGGDGGNYVRFWGLSDQKARNCFRGDYPTMFAQANRDSRNPVTRQQMEGVYAKGQLADTSAGDALGNAMAAILISEAERDTLVIAENYMLMQLGAEPQKIIGGHCLPGSAQSCQNTSDSQDGRHPIAWGGAINVMMTGAWGRDLGATSEFGEKFETQLIAEWLSETNRSVILANSGACRQPIRQLMNLSTERQNLVKGFFSAVLPKFGR